VRVFAHVEGTFNSTLGIDRLPPGCADGYGVKDQDGVRPTGGGQIVSSRERHEGNRDPRDVLGTGRINDP